MYAFITAKGVDTIRLCNGRVFMCIQIEWKAHQEVRCMCVSVCGTRTLRFVVETRKLWEENERAIFYTDTERYDIGKLILFKFY